MVMRHSESKHLLRQTSSSVKAMAIIKPLLPEFTYLEWWVGVFNSHELLTKCIFPINSPGTLTFTDSCPISKKIHINLTNLQDRRGGCCWLRHIPGPCFSGPLQLLLTSSQNAPGADIGVDVQLDEDPATGKQTGQGTTSKMYEAGCH